MIVLSVTNVHEALPKALHLLQTCGVKQESRNGPVLVVPEPVCTVYDKPDERVIFHPWRDANPFFHFYESLWMLAGRRDIKPLVRFARQLAEYSDNGSTQNAAYGYRWRHARLETQNTDDGPWDKTLDQLPLICQELRMNPSSRQCVLQIWDHVYDLGTRTKDHACNLMATFQVVSGRLDMCVFCRSNDIAWGCYGANAVHFSMLHEYIALRSRHPIGKYSQISVNWHGYLKTIEPILEFHSAEDVGSPYETEPVYPAVISSAQTEDEWARWDVDCQEFVTSDGRAPQFVPIDPFFHNVAMPIVKAHDAYKDYPGDQRFERALYEIEKCHASDWKLACKQWLQRRYDKYLAAPEPSVESA